MGLPDIDRFLAPDYLGDLSARTTDEIRAMRGECQRAETSLSYLRRLVQGRIDILAADLRSRTEGHGAADPADLVVHLPEILGEHVHEPGTGRLPTYLAPPDDDAHLTDALDEIVDAQTISELRTLSDEQVHALVDRLTDLERTVSAQRRALFELIDPLQAELTRRYKSGEATVESLLR
jgi:transposase